MFDGFITGRMREYKKSNELLLVTATAVSLDNVRGHGFRGASNLATLLIHLELWQVLERHAMHSNRYLSRQLPNFKISIAHRVSRIPHLAFRITIRLRAKSRRELVLFACRIAMKATPERASKLPRVPRSVSAPCPGRTRKRSSPECRQPAP